MTIDSALWGEHPDATRVVTVPCAVCGQTADLLDPENEFNIIDGVHEWCRDGDPNEPHDTDWMWQE